MAAAAERASAQLAKGDRKFAFILADPPTIWLGGQGRAAPYGCMTLAAICAIPESRPPPPPCCGCGRPGRC